MKLNSLHEGKFPITPDMANFAVDGERKIASTKEATGEVVFRREVDGGKYGKKEIKIALHPAPHRNYADVETNTIHISKNPRQPYYRQYESMIKHELVHLFDPKVTDKNLRNKSWGVENVPEDLLGRLSDKKYYELPWEVDAYMATRAEDHIKNMIRKGYDKEQIRQIVSEPEPTTEYEGFIHGNKKLWRKYKRVLHDEYKKING